MLEKRTVLGQIEVLNNGVIFIKELNQIIEIIDGKEVLISSTPHRFPVNPLQDPSLLKYQNAIDIANVLWTQSVKDAYSAEMLAKTRVV